MAEYPFKDLLPRDEVLEREGYYKDWTHLDPETFYSITQISEMIKTKGYGADVRLLISQLAEHFGLSVVEVTDIANELIARQDAVEDFNNQVIQEMTDKDVISAPEIIAARGGKPSLGARLDETTAQLAQTMTQTEFDGWVATLLDGGPSIFMDSLAVLQSTYPNGASGVALVRETDPAKIYAWDGGAWKDFGDYQGIELKSNSVESLNLKRKSVGDREAKFPLVRTESTSNLFDNTTAIAGFYVGSSSGRILPSSGNTASDWIEINPSEVYTMRHRDQVAFYDEQREYISGFGIDPGTGQQPYTFISPASARYIRMTTTESRTGTQQLNRGDTLLTYERGAPVVSGKHIKEASITPDKLDARTNELVYRLQKNRNLFDAENTTEGFYIGSGSGNLLPMTNYYTSEYIPIIPEKSYFIKHRDQSAFYDVNYNYISGIPADAENTNQPYSFTTPKNARFMRISVHKWYLNEQKLNTGSVLWESPKRYQNRFNITFLGDSITASPTGWTKYIIDELLPTSATNLAVPSASFTDKTTDTTDPNYAYDGNPVNGGLGNNNTFGNQVQKMINGGYPVPDIILVSFGTNDGLGTTPITIPEIPTLISDQFALDISEVDKTTWAGAIRSGVERLQNAYPDARIILCTPIQATDGHYYRAYDRQIIRRELVVSVANRLSLEVIDNFNCGIYGRNEPFEAEGKYLSDGIHPNSLGRETQGKFATNKLINLLYT